MQAVVLLIHGSGGCNNWASLICSSEAVGASSTRVSQRMREPETTFFTALSSGAAFAGFSLQRHHNAVTVVDPKAVYDHAVSPVPASQLFHARAVVWRFYYFKSHDLLLRFPFDGCLSTDTGLYLDALIIRYLGVESTVRSGTRTRTKRDIQLLKPGETTSVAAARYPESSLLRFSNFQSSSWQAWGPA